MVQLKHLARALDISASMCSRLARRGMPVDDVERARRWRRRHLELARTKGARMHVAGSDSQTSAPGAVAGAEGEGVADDPPAAGDLQEYREARAQRERLRAERERIELGQLTGRLIDARQAEEFQFSVGRITRDCMEQVGPRFAAEIHSLVVSLVPVEQREKVAGLLDLHAVETRMAAVIREGLQDAAKAIEDLERGDDDDC